jgi:hypothetical protein
MTTLGYTLIEHQKEHVQRVVDTLSERKSIIDLSLMGRGKTFTTSYAATVLKCIMIVVCPASVEPKWNEMRTKYNAPVWKVISYESLRGVKGKQPSHDFLVRTDKKTQKGTFTKFTASKTLKYITKKYNVMFVFDEVQKTKNASATAKACIALASHAYTTKNSKVMLLSGTPLDKEKQCVNMLRMMGLVTSGTLCFTDAETGIVRQVGFKKLYQTCKRLEPLTMNVLEDEYSLKKATNYPKIAYQMFIQIVLKHLSSKMPDDLKTKQLSIKNRYFRCTDNEKSQLTRHINSMKSFFNEDQTRMIQQDINSFGAIQKALFNIELVKVNIISRNAINVLKNNPKTKVCIMLNFTEPLTQLAEALGNYHPVVVNGKVPKHKRIEILSKFQEDTDECRLVIANMDVLSTGVDLDDKFGGRPRYVFASPNYKTMIIQQMTYRFLRADTKSDTSIDFVYGDCKAEESSILGCLSKKACVMRDASKDSNNDQVMYPDQYPKVVG